MKRSAFRILCPARTAARGTISGRRPPVRVPWPYGITVQLVPESKIDCISHGPRAVCVRASGMVRRQVCGLRQRFRRALGTERADGKSENKPYLRAHIQIQTDVQTEPRDRKPFGRNWMESKGRSAGAPSPGGFLLPAYLRSVELLSSASIASTREL